MCKTCKCKKNENVGNVLNVNTVGTLDKKRYFSAVTDVIEKSCKTGEEPVILDTYRYFNDKFVDTPEKALLFAFDNSRKAWKVDPAEILADVKYDPENEEYVRRTILTRDGHKPNEKQKAKILDGTYEFILVEEYVQVFETNIMAGEYLISSAIDQWRKHTGKEF